MSSDMEQRIRDRFAELGSEIHSPEFQMKARDAMVGVLREEMALRNVPDNFASGLLRLLSVATIPRGTQ